MENLKLLYTGKTKNVYELPNGNCQDFSSQQSSVDTAVDGYGCYRNAGGHHNSGQQSVHTVEAGTLAG